MDVLDLVSKEPIMLNPKDLITKADQLNTQFISEKLKNNKFFQKYKKSHEKIISDFMT